MAHALRAAGVGLGARGRGKGRAPRPAGRARARGPVSARRAGARGGVALARERGGGGGGAMAGAQRRGRRARDAHVVMSVLKSMGVEETDDRVVQQLLEFMHRYVGEVLDDACAYAEHRGGTARGSSSRTSTSRCRRA